jgi:hypothetical protein
MKKINESSTINALLNAYDTTKVSNPVLKAAIEKHKAEQEERAAADMLENLRQVDQIMLACVNDLRSIRKKEARQRAFVLEINKAKEEFLKDGDIQKFKNTFYNFSSK